MTGRKKTKADDVSARYNKPFAQRLRVLIGESGKSHAEIAQHFGVSRQGVGKWANGETTPDIETIVNIAEYFGISTDYLLGRTDIKSPDTTKQAVCNYLDLSESSLFILKAIGSINMHKKSANINDWVIQNILPEICFDISEILCCIAQMGYNDITTSHFIYSLIVKSSDKYKYRLDEYIAQYFKENEIDNYKSVFDFKDDIVFKLDELNNS